MLGPFGRRVGAKLALKVRVRTLRGLRGRLRDRRGGFWSLRGWILEPPGSILEPPDPFFSHPSETFFEKHRFRSEGVHLSPSHDAHPPRENVVFGKKVSEGCAKKGSRGSKIDPGGSRPQFYRKAVFDRTGLKQPSKAVQKNKSPWEQPHWINRSPPVPSLLRKEIGSRCCRSPGF